jgi:hypothetical protein
MLLTLPGRKRERSETPKRDGDRSRYRRENRRVAVSRYRHRQQHPHLQHPGTAAQQGWFLSLATSTYNMKRGGESHNSFSPHQSYTTRIIRFSRQPGGGGKKLL